MDYFEYFKFLRANPDKIELCPQLQELDGYCWGMLLAEHPQLAPFADFAKITGENLRYLLEYQPQFAERCDLAAIPPDDWWRILLKQPQLAEYCPAWSFRLNEWADLLTAQPQFFKRCDNICHLLLEYPELYETWKLQDWSNYKITIQSCIPLVQEKHTLPEWYDIIMKDRRKCVCCDCLLDLVLQYPEIFAQWCKFGTGSFYQPVFWQLTKNLCTAGENIMEKMIEKFSKKYDIIPELFESAFLDCPPPEEVEDIADFSNDYLVKFLRCFEWYVVQKMTVDLDWKRFDAVQWGKLTAFWGDKLDGKSDVVPFWGHEEWAYIISMVPEHQLNATLCDCDKWDEFTAKDWGTVYAKCDEVDAKVEAAIKNFSHQDWYDFLTNCQYREDFFDRCPDLEVLKKEFPELVKYFD
ncbi:MAG: hypothetical protein J6W00_05135 [Lentisphaeria bacterium]|nr:hypothetical protein [Lentisphaeria bacterium]